MSRALLCLLGAVLLASCASPPPAPKEVEAVPPYEELKLSALKDLVKTAPARAAEAVTLLLEKGESSSGLPPSELEALITEVGEGFAASYRSSLDAQDYAAALSYFRSIRALAALPRYSALLGPEAGTLAKLPATREGELGLSDADALVAKGYSLAGLIRYLSLIQTMGDGPLPGGEEALSRFTDLARSLGNRPALALLKAVYLRRGQKPPTGLDELLSSKDSLAVMRKGVVTIRVDRGIKIEQGVGSPDRVLGSGFYIDAGGYLLTNYHVIASEVDPSYEGYSHLSIRPADSPEDRIPARVVGWDPLLDLALLKASETPKYVFSLGSSADLNPGERIFAIGSPVGLENTVTAGIVSAVGRRLMESGEAVQVDAALNPGNSGGPLIDEAGSAAGIVFAGIPQYQGLNFAIPSEWILRVLPALFGGDEIKRAWLGFVLASEPSSKGGIEILYRHPATGAILVEGKRLLAFDGVPVKSVSALQALLLDHAPGELVLLKVAGDEGERSVLRALTERPAAPLDSAIALDRRERLFPALFGMRIEPMPSGFLGSESYTIAKIWPGSIADEAGLSENDPFALRRFIVEKKQRLALIQIYVKKRKAGFLESVIQIPAPLDIADFV